MQNRVVNIKFSDVIGKFSGDRDQDINEWLDKAEQVATLQHIEDLHLFIPLFLTGAAHAVYNQIPEEDKQDYEAVKKQLMSAFSPTPYQAYELFKNRCLQEGESPDVFLAELRKLLRLTGANDGIILGCQFVNGLPGDVSAQVKALKAESADINTLLACAKAVMANREPMGYSAVGRFQKPMVNGPPRRDWRTFGRSTPRCDGCGKMGHIQSECRTECYNCRERGHFSRNCPSGNGRGGAAKSFAQACASQSADA